MKLIFGALGDPVFKGLFLFWGKDFVSCRRRHDLFCVGLKKAGDKVALRGFAGCQNPGFNRIFGPIQAQIPLARRAVGSVASETVLGKNRPNVAVVF